LQVGKDKLVFKAEEDSPETIVLINAREEKGNNS